jgi:voltage-gated potassium channel
MLEGRSGWLGTIGSHFVLCTFTGLLVLKFFREGLSRLITSTEQPAIAGLLVGSAFAGLVVAAATWLVHHTWLRPLTQRYVRNFEKGIYREHVRRGVLVGFVCGALCPLYATFSILLPALTLAFMLLIVVYARTFLRRAGVILRPGNYPTPEDVLKLLFLYAGLIASFTVLHLSLTSIYLSAGVETGPFVGLSAGSTSIVDHFYFTVVVMTTLGFGDISPVTPVAKLLIAFEVIIAYLFFALLVGTITRGILPHGDAGDSPQDETEETR